MNNVLIGEDLDSFLGYDPEAIEKIDIEKSKENYETMVLKRLMEWYPDIDFSFNWNSNNHIELNDDYNEDILRSDIEVIEEYVYNSQEFWVVKGE